SYTAPPDAIQKGTSTKIDTGDARILGTYYRGNGVWASQGTGCTFTGDTATRACLRWYQLNTSASGVTQQSTFGLSGSYYFYPAIAADNSGSFGNAVIAFHRVSSAEFGSVRYTGRLSTTA